MKNICILGVGGAGVQIIGRTKGAIDVEKLKKNKSIKYGLITTNLEEIAFIREYSLKLDLDTEIADNKTVYEPIVNRTVIREIDYLAIGKNTCRELGAYTSPEKAEEAFYESEENIDIFLNKLLKEIDLVILVAGFGGGNGTGILPLLLKKTIEMNKKTICVIQKPFRYEGKRRIETFNKGMEKIKQITNDYVIIESDSILNELEKGVSLVETFKQMNLKVAIKIIEIIKKDDEIKEQ